MDGEPRLATSHRLPRLAARFRDKQYRDGYVTAHTRRVLAEQMRNFRGEFSQTEYAAKIGKQKTMVARLENPAYGGWSLRTMFEIAQKENVAVLVRFVDFLTFLGFTDDMSDESLHPRAYDEIEVDRFVAYQSGQVSHYDFAPAPDGNNATLIGGAPTNEDLFFNPSLKSPLSNSMVTYTTTPTMATTLSTVNWVGSGAFVSAGSLFGFGAQLSPLPFKSPFALPATPSALRRAYAEIERQEQMIRVQAQEIQSLKDQLGQFGTAVPPVDERLSNPQSQVIPFSRTAARG
jgi:hypothetical protein